MAEPPVAVPAFAVSRLPRIEFGDGAIARLPAIVAGYGRRALLVTGAASFRATPHWPALLDGLRRAGVAWRDLAVAGEPSPHLVDRAVRDLRGDGIDIVVGIGGGSALDAAKAIAGLLRPGNSVMDHLEGVGPELPYRGPAVPFVAVPTTAGTGSEATRNAVLSVPGPDGFKKSFRDEKLVAEVALVDPALMATCPPALIAADGMDALTQLLESYVSTRANPFTDALALSGLAAVRDGLLAWHGGEGDPAAARARMAYAALLSGITLAQAGLGAVHGLAAPLGAFFPIPHGVACGTLVADATAANLAALRARAPDSPALAKYAAAARVLLGGADIPPPAAGAGPGRGADRTRAGLLAGSMALSDAVARAGSKALSGGSAGFIPSSDQPRADLPGDEAPAARSGKAMNIALTNEPASADLSGDEAHAALPDELAHAALVDLLRDWTERLAIPRLGAYGVTVADVPRITAASRGSSMKTNPIILADAEIAAVVKGRT